MKRFLSLCLIAAMLTASLASCSNNPANSEETTSKTNAVNAETSAETEEETKKYLDDLPESMDFEGYNMRFIVEEGGNGNLTELSIMAAEDTGEVVDSAVYTRNMAVQERLNITIDLVDVIKFSGLPGTVRPSIQAGSDDYDIIGTYQYYGIVMGPEGLMLNLSKLDNLDFTREYWGSGYIENMSYKGITYWATGDIALRYTGGMYVTYINDEIWKDHYPDINIYDVVNEGAWTLDKLNEYSDSVYVDNNGNGKIDFNDTFGFVFDIEDPTEGMAAGSMIRFSERDESGTPYVSLNNERTFTFYEKMYNIVANNTGFWHSEDDNNTVMKMFAENRAMIGVNKLFQSGIYLRDMEQEFKIIPVPKLNEEQEHYNTMLHDGVTLFGIPITNQKTYETTVVLECMASESLKTVTPAYYEVALKVKYARDNESGMMIDLIRENVAADFAALYSNSIGNVVHFFRNNLQTKTENIASVMEKNQKLWTKALDKLLTNIEENSDK
ncbi:MAG: hypothetical protein ACI4XJ_03000 [Eubacteriales bacterium]